MHATASADLTLPDTVPPEKPSDGATWNFPGGNGVRGKLHLRVKFNSGFQGAWISDRGGYCYTAIHFTSDAVLLAYCAGEPEDRSRLARLKVRKIRLSDIVSSQEIE